MTITSIGYAGSVDEAAWAKIAASLGSTYGVQGPGDWQVTADPTGDRQVKIAIGSGHGRGIYDTSDAVATVQLAAVASGTRWDLVYARRDWQTGVKATSFARTTGTATREIPAGRANNPGVQDDQPLALVQLTAGQSVPTAVVDLRCWAVNGGVLAVDGLALWYLDAVGACVRIGDVEYMRTLDPNGTPVWKTSFTTPNTQLVRTRGAMAGLPKPDTELAIEQVGYDLGQTNASGDFRVNFPKVFPHGLLSVKWDLWGGLGVPEPGAYLSMGWGDGGGAPTLDHFFFRVFSPAGIPIQNGYFGVSWRAIGW